MQEGSEVKKGDLLVSGQVPVRNDQQEVTGYQYHQADAQILAEVSTSYQDEMDLFYIKKDYDLVKKREVFLQVGPWRLTFGSIRNSYDYWTMEGYEKELFGIMHFMESILWIQDSIPLSRVAGKICHRTDTAGFKHPV
mgnify:CR=1 FL=1